MALQTVLQVLGFIGASIAGAVGMWKLIDELLRKGKTSLKEDYRFAKEFFANINSDDVHPVVAELGYQAVAGDSRVSADEVSYLLGLQNPRLSLRNYIGAKRLLEFFSTAPIQKIAFRPRYQSNSWRRWLKYWYLSAYFTTYTLGFAPLPLISLKLLSVTTGLSLLFLSAIMFLPLAYLSVKAARRLSMAESLLKAQEQSLGARGVSAAASSNPSIERTSLSWLRQPKAAAHIER